MSEGVRGSRTPNPSSVETRGNLWKKSLGELFVQSNREDPCGSHSSRSLGRNSIGSPTSVEGQLSGQQNFWKKKSAFPDLILENPVEEKILTEEDLFNIETESRATDDLAISDTNLGPGTGLGSKI